MAGASSACDESKCVSLGLSEDHSTFTCYYAGGDSHYDVPIIVSNKNNYFPMMCADGYQPRPVDAEPLVRTDMYGINEDDFHYFTSEVGLVA